MQKLTVLRNEEKEGLTDMVVIKKKNLLDLDIEERMATPKDIAMQKQVLFWTI